MERSCFKGCFCSKEAFALIELLVVVLIIGILAAVALPQYQTAVEKADNIEAIELLKSLSQAQRAYILANDTYATRFDQLDVTLPWTGQVSGTKHSWRTDSRSNDKWSVELLIHTEGWPMFYITRLKGKYKGGGFGTNIINRGDIYCLEWYNGDFLKNNKGAFCEKLYNGTVAYSEAGIQTYKLP